MSAINYKDVPGYPGYRVGDDGTLWSRLASIKNPNGEWRELQGGLDKDGYHKAILCRDGERRHVRVHSLVLEVFIGPAPDGMNAAHNNGIRTDNRLCNLRWDNHANNIADKKIHGTHQAGERHGMHKLTADLVRELRADYASGQYSYKQLGQKYGILKMSAHNIVKRRTWRTV